MPGLQVEVLCYVIGELHIYVILYLVINFMCALSFLFFVSTSC